jgi:hypothetical protein
MSGRSDTMGKLARTLAQQVGVRVEATYDSYGRTWQLTWCDGPTVEAVRKRVRKATRTLPGIDATAVRYIRNRTELAVVAAFLAYVLPQPAVLSNLPIEALHAYDTTDFPGSIDAEVWEMARFAMDQVGGPAVYDADRKTIDHIVKIGINGLRLDMWLATDGRQTDCQPALPAVNPHVLSEDVRLDLARVLSRVQNELVGGSAHQRDPRVQLLVAETTRKLLLDEVEAHQRRTAAHALVDGAGLSSLSTMIGLSARTLGMRFGQDLDTELAPLVWLRDHAVDWAGACVAAARAVRDAPNFYSGDARHELWALERADASGGWRALTGTPDAARLLLAVTRRYPPGGAEHELLRLRVMLDAYDHAQPPGRRERAMRRPVTTSTAPSPHDTHAAG